MVQLNLARSQFSTVDEPSAARLDAMQTFLADYPGGQAVGPDLSGSLPDLPFADDRFEIAVTANLLFLLKRSAGPGFPCYRAAGTEPVGDVWVLAVLESGLRAVAAPAEIRNLCE